MMEDHAREVGTHLRSLVEGAQRAESDKASREAWVTSLGEALARSEARLDRVEDELRVRLAELAESRGQAADLRREADRSRSELTRVLDSAGYRMALGTGRRMRNWFPQGTLRGSMLARMRRAAYRRLEQRSVEVRRTERPTPAPETPFVSGVADVTPPVYQRWIDRFEPGDAELEAQRSEVGSLPYRPLMSIVVPTWRPVPGHLNHMLESMREQTYDRWELCVADGGSDLEVRRLLSKFRARDDRIKVRYLDENKGISGNTSEALALATGEFVAFVDQSDVLAPNALAEVVLRLNRDPGLDVLNSDWDLLSEDGLARFNPFFTPEWSPEMLLSSNYMTHLSVVRRSLIDAVGGLRPELDGAQDWDLLLRVTERTDRVARIPAVLYHWRADPSSAVLSLDAKPQAEAAQWRAVTEHLERRGDPADVIRSDDGRIRIRWPIRDRPTVSIIIPTLHNRELLERCLAGIGRSAYPEREVIVIETAGRTLEREAWYRELDRRHPVRVLWWEGPFNYSAVNNLGAREASGDVLVFLNDDTEPLTEDWLDEIVGWLQQDGVGVVGAQLLAEDGSIQHGGVILKLGGFADHLFRGLEPGSWTLLGSPDWYRNVSAVTGACLAISRSTLERVGGWDEGFQLCGGDVELGLRLRRHGLRAMIDPFIRVRHIERATRGSTIPQSDFALSFWHYQRYIYGTDPYFNPNLSEAATIPELREEGDRSSLDVVSEVLGRDVRPRAPSHDADETEGLIAVCRVSPDDLEGIARSHDELRGRREVGSLTWFIPDFENPHYGGIHTIFRFADYLARVHGVKNRFAVIGTGPESYIRSGLHATFPDIADSEIVMAPGGADADLDRVPYSDAAICTLWVTAYPMARWRGADRMFSFVQDFEPMFYPAGPLYALAEQTYRMGFYGIANTPPLKEIYESYGQAAVSFTPCVDTDVFHDRRPPRPPDDPLTVFLYGRPGHPRNSYQLAVAALEKVKRSMGERLRVVSAGSWSGIGGQDPWLDRLGLLGYRETADLYRRCDGGLVLSVSKHPTYIPLQLMACGALVVANHNPANGWLLRDGENAILADPTVDGLAAAVEAGLIDRDQRETLTAQASKEILTHHADWGPEIDRVYEFLCDPEAD
jgi:GT2 family glycosyltransferase/glycosyltransferase involved in cell wall biosynthesis